MGHYAYLWVGPEGVVQLGLEPGVVPGIVFPCYMVGQLEPEIGVGVALPAYMVGQLEPEIRIGIAFPAYMVGQLQHDLFLVASPFYAGNCL